MKTETRRQEGKKAIASVIASEGLVMEMRKYSGLESYLKYVLIQEIGS